MRRIWNASNATLMPSSSLLPPCSLCSLASRSMAATRTADAVPNTCWAMRSNSSHFLASCQQPSDMPADNHASRGVSHLLELGLIQAPGVDAQAVLNGAQQLVVI